MTGTISSLCLLHLGTQEIIATDKTGNRTTVTVTVNNGHTAGNDDNNCTTPVYCIYHPDTVMVAAKSHDFSGDWNKDATNHWHICQNEGCTVTDTPIPHSGGSANCTAKAECEYCGEEYGELNSNNHTGGTEIRGAKDATCKEEGYTGDTYCKGCRAKLSKGETITKLAHVDSDKDHICDVCEETFSEHSGGTATCKAKAICDTCKTEYGELDSNNHNLENIPAKEATVTKTGNIEYWHCADCGKYFSDKEATSSIRLEDTVIAKIKQPRLQAAASGNSSIKLQWSSVPTADGYVIYMSKCGKKYEYKAVKTIKGNKTLSWKESGLKKKTPYKAYVKAYVMKDGKKVFISKSPSVHLYTTGSTKNYTNPKSVTVNKTSLSLAAGKTYKLKAKVNKLKENKKLMPTTHAPNLRYLSSDTDIATVTSSGTIKAKAKGTCNIYVYAANGAYKTVKLTVK